MEEKPYYRTKQWCLDCVLAAHKHEPVEIETLIKEAEEIYAFITK